MTRWPKALIASPISSLVADGGTRNFEPLPAGVWPSPIDADQVASSSVRLGQVEVSHPAGGSEAVWWDERRPDEDGRTQIVRRGADGVVADVLPEGYSASSRVHEYGGAAWWLAGETVFWVDDADQRIWRLDPGFDPTALTPPPLTTRGWRYADGVLTADWRWIICVAEIHPGEVAHDGRPEAMNVLAAVPATGGEPRILWALSDFVSSPRIDPETSLVAWVTWDHPDMPWDTTRLWVADLDCSSMMTPRLVDPVCVAGGTEESISQPEWDPHGRLWFISDRSDWWSLWRFEASGRPTGDPVPADPRPAEIGVPAWNFGIRRYAFLSDGRVIEASRVNGLDTLSVLDPLTGIVDPVAVPLTSIQTLAVSQTTVVMIGASFTSEPAVHAVLVGRSGAAGGHQVLRAARDLGMSSAWVSVGQPIAYPTSDGARSHAIFYPPTNPDWSLVEGERPPALVMVHGGPVSAARPELRMLVQFWTSRGWAVIDVNHRGSTGYGRRYRTELRQKWGVIDVADAADAVRHLAAAGRIDSDRAVIRGGSAGGFTTLLSVAVTDVYAAGASYYGVADLVVLAQDSHKFESHDVDILIGPYPADAEVYRERSPLYRAGEINAPLIVFQGTEDVVVTPVQAELIVAALRERGVAHAYVVLEGEGHGFRRAETIASTLAAEWSFFVQVLDLPHPDDLHRTEIWRPH